MELRSYDKCDEHNILRFMNISQGSLEECRDYIILSRDLGYLATGQFEQLRDTVEQASKLLNGYCKGIINNVGVSD